MCPDDYIARFAIGLKITCSSLLSVWRLTDLGELPEQQLGGVLEEEQESDAAEAEHERVLVRLQWMGSGQREAG